MNPRGTEQSRPPVSMTPRLHDEDPNGTSVVEVRVFHGHGKGQADCPQQGQTSPVIWVSPLTRSVAGQRSWGSRWGLLAFRSPYVLRAGATARIGNLLT